MKDINKRYTNLNFYTATACVHCCFIWRLSTNHIWVGNQKLNHDISLTVRVTKVIKNAPWGKFSAFNHRHSSKTIVGNLYIMFEFDWSPTHFMSFINSKKIRKFWILESQWYAVYCFVIQINYNLDYRIQKQSSHEYCILKYTYPH